MNDKVLTPDLAPGHEGQFLAVGQGHTQVRAAMPTVRPMPK